jgi:GRF zinc finger
MYLRLLNKPLENVTEYFCLSGPTLLFERYTAGSAYPRRYYACSACRDSKECTFFRWADEVKTKSDEQNNRQLLTCSSHIKDFSRLTLFPCLFITTLSSFSIFIDVDTCTFLTLHNVLCRLSNQQGKNAGDQTF